MPPSQPTPRINRLSATLAGQIAAGEVIERPASIIKELVENSLDAGADRIDIEVEQGGIHSIRVRDNGHGIHPDDMALALESHATSKLHSAADLEAIRSLGFRGEALASIAAVAGMQLTSCMQGADQAWTVDMAAGGSGPPQPQPAGHPVGTTVRVAALFQSVPARRKFLRAERTEFLHILETVRRLALSRFEVDIRLRHNRRQVLHCRPSGGDSERRIRDIMGAAFLRDAACLEHRAGDLRLWGWLGGPDQARSQSDRQYFYLNGRMLRDRMLTHAVRRALETAIPAGRFPSYVLHLELDPARTDVNVHPTKQEVRFRQARDVHDFIHAAVREASGPASQSGAASAAAPGGYRGQPGGTGRRAPVAELAALYRTPETDAGPGAAAAEPAGMVDGYALVRVGPRILLLDARQTMLRSVRRQLQAALDGGSPVTSRPLLVPLVLECRESDMEPLLGKSELLTRLGLELEQAGPVSLRLRSIPSLLAQAELPSLVAGLCSALARGEGDAQRQCLDVLAGHAAAAVTAAGAGVDVPDLLQRAAELEAGPDPDLARGLWRYLEPGDLALLLRQGRNGALP